MNVFFWRINAQKDEEFNLNHLILLIFNVKKQEYLNQTIPQSNSINNLDIYLHIIYKTWLLCNVTISMDVF
jgi:hypothetical protein